MTKSWLIGTTALMALATGAWAADEKAAAPAAMPPHAEGMEHGGHEEGMMGGEGRGHFEGMTLEKARERAHKRAEKLDKMTQEEWEQHKKQRMERRAKWEAMTPEEREKHKQEMREKFHRKHDDAAKPAVSTPAPAAAPAGK